MIDKNKISEAVSLLSEWGVSFSISDGLVGGMFINPHEMEKLIEFEGGNGFFAYINGVSLEAFDKYGELNMHDCQCVALTRKGARCTAISSYHMGQDKRLKDFAVSLESGNWENFYCETHRRMSNVKNMFSHEAKPREAAKPREKKEGFVYLVKEKNQGHIKIGRAVDVKNRMRTFSLKLPFKIDLLHSFKCPDYVTAEKALHDYFDTEHVNGEWFKLSESDIESIVSGSVLDHLGIEVIS